MKRYCLLTLFITALTCLYTPHVTAQTFYICQEKNTATTSLLSFSSGSFEAAAIDSITLTPPAGQRFVGGDVSMLAKYEAQGAQYKDIDGKPVSDVLAFLKEQGWNTMRVRLFVDPSKDSDKAVIQDLDYVIALGKRIKAAGLLFMLWLL